MDIVLVQASAYDLPTSRRVGVIVHDGATDARLWPGPGADRELLAAYGPGLQDALERERDKVAGAALPIGAVMRLHPGRLHCDFLVWVATRGPEQRGRQAPAPDRATLEAAVRRVLDFVSERNVIRVAFPALGAGPGAIDDAERLAVLARACHAWHEARFAEGRPTEVEQVLVCDPRLSVVSGARRMLGALAKTAAPSSGPAPSAGAERRPAGPGTPKARSARAAVPRKPRLEEADVARARATAAPWDRTRRYAAGDWFVHAKFGVGRVEALTPDGKIVVLFEDGECRTLVHAPAG